jgi:hypothetical protein
MLVDVSCRSTRLYQGVYQSRWWNFELEFRGRQVYELDYPEFIDDPDFSNIGVCDSPEQLLSKLPKSVTEGAEKFVVSVVKISKEDEPASGGWRWHKWGPYIGDKEPTAEYLHDEPDIDVVWTYHVYVVEPPKGPEELR